MDVSTVGVFVRIICGDVCVGLALVALGAATRFPQTWPSSAASATRIGGACERTHKRPSAIDD
jgi:hypothetical protein